MKRLLLGGTLLLGSAGCGCIARGTKVRTPKGERPIEELAAGDEVHCIDTAAQALAVTRVLATRMVKRECALLEVSGRTLELTTDHPLYCPVRAEWAPAGDWVLRKRSALLWSVDERVERMLVEDTRVFSAIREVFDLSVDGPHHNFLANGVLVHNKSIVYDCPVPDSGLLDGGAAAAPLTDGGTTLRYGSSCTCPTGGKGYVRCESPGSLSSTCACQ